MKRHEYEAYLEYFNRRDYDGVLEYFADAPVVIFAGYALQGKQVIRDFYAFFHDHVQEKIQLQNYSGNENFVAIEAIVRLEAKQDMPIELLEKRGLGQLFALEKGQIIEMPQFIHYHLTGGKFSKAVCAVIEPPLAAISKLGG